MTCPFPWAPQNDPIVISQKPRSYTEVLSSHSLTPIHHQMLLILPPINLWNLSNSLQHHQYLSPRCQQLSPKCIHLSVYSHYWVPEGSSPLPHHTTHSPSKINQKQTNKRHLISLLTKATKSCKVWPRPAFGFILYHTPPHSLRTGLWAF